MAVAGENATNVPIEYRQMAFPFEGLKRRFFFRNNAVLSSFVAALSATFPPGEREFVRSVVGFRKAISDKQLLAEVKAFSAQEGHHAMQHKRINEALEALGYPVEELSAHLEAEIQTEIKSASMKERLAFTVGMEHLTAIMAHYILEHPEALDGVAEPVRQLLRWHAVEEIEHKAVAFDVYQQAVGDKQLLRKAFVIQTVMFFVTIFRMQAYILQRLGHRPRLSEISQAVWYLLGPGGLFPSITPAFLRYFKGDFHPWQEDDSHLIRRWQESTGAQEHQVAMAAE